MSDCVVDASFIAKANGCLSGVQPGNLLQRRLAAIGRIVAKKDLLRFNAKLLSEYEPHIRECRNDVVEQFVALLDTPDAIRVKRNTLSHADKARANDCRWPTHDQHVLAAAIGGDETTIHLTENQLGSCAADIRRIFGFKINHVA